MFAVIKTGGKQYRVAEDDTIAVEKLPGNPGDMVELKDVLLIGEEGKAPTIGTPVIEKASVFALVVDQTRADKIIVFKKHRRKNYRRKKGHRQDQTVLRIAGISPTGTPPAKKAVKAKPAAKPESGPAAEGKVETESKPQVEVEAKVKAKAKAAPKEKTKTKAKAKTKTKAKAKTKGKK